MSLSGDSLTQPYPISYLCQERISCMDSLICCFQIWIKKETKRDKIIYDKMHSDFNFLKYGPKDKNNQPTPPQNCDFVIKAYGGNCGEIIDTELHLLRPKSWHWLKSTIDIEQLKNRFRQLDYSMSEDTVRQDSLGQQELIYLYKQKYKT